MDSTFLCDSEPTHVSVPRYIKQSNREYNHTVLRDSYRRIIRSMLQQERVRLGCFTLNKRIIEAKADTKGMACFTRPGFQTEETVAELRAEN